MDFIHIVILNQVGVEHVMDGKQRGLFKALEPRAKSMATKELY